MATLRAMLQLRPGASASSFFTPSTSSASFPPSSSSSQNNSNNSDSHSHSHSQLLSDLLPPGMHRSTIPRPTATAPTTSSLSTISTSSNSSKKQPLNLGLHSGAASGNLGEYLIRHFFSPSLTLSHSLQSRGSVYTPCLFFSLSPLFPHALLLRPLRQRRRRKKRVCACFSPSLPSYAQLCVLRKRRKKSCIQGTRSFHSSLIPLPSLFLHAMPPSCLAATTHSMLLLLHQHQSKSTPPSPSNPLTLVRTINSLSLNLGSWCLLSTPLFKQTFFFRSVGVPRKQHSSALK